jgi:hypothetical protein
VEEQERTETAEETEVEAHLLGSKPISASDEPSDELEESDVEAHSMRYRPANH